MKSYTQSEWHSPGYYAPSEQIVLSVDSEGVLIDFARQIDDVLITSPEGDVLISWSVDHQSKEFPKDKCLLLSSRDNLKEIGKIETDLLAICAIGNEPVTVYVTAQRN
jgi:hypothetical protein